MTAALPPLTAALAVVAALGWYEARRWKRACRADFDRAAANGAARDLAFSGLLAVTGERDELAAILAARDRDAYAHLGTVTEADRAWALDALRADALHTLAPGHGGPAQARTRERTSAQTWLVDALAGPRETAGAQP